MTEAAVQHETEVVSGLLDSVVQKGPGKWQAVVKTADAQQHGRKCWTKSETHHAALTALIGQQVTLNCNVSHWTNPQGAAVRSLWIEEVIGGPAPAGVSAAVAVAGGGKPVSPDEPRQQSIERQTALKAAVESFPSGATDVEILGRAEAFAAFIAGIPAPKPLPPSPTADGDIPF